MAKLGIDISTHQGFIDLAAIKDKIDFVIIRVGFGKGATELPFPQRMPRCRLSRQLLVRQ